MKITPLDIQQQQFKGKVFGGLDPEDVDTFLQLVSREMEDMIREINDLREQARKAAADMADLAEREKNLRETLLAAQRISEEMKTNAQKEASLMISEAELRAAKIVSDVENRANLLRNEIQDLRRQKTQFHSALRSLLDSHYKMINVDET